MDDSEISTSKDVSHQFQNVSKEYQTSSNINNVEKMVSVCRECHETCLNSRHGNNIRKNIDAENCGDTWGSLMMLGICGILPTIKNSNDPFEPSGPPSISILPPTPDKKHKVDDKSCNGNNNYILDDGDGSRSHKFTTTTTANATSSNSSDPLFSSSLVTCIKVKCRQSS